MNAVQIDRYGENGSRVFLTTLQEDFHYSLFLPGKFAFNPAGKLPWLQKILFAILKKLHAEAYEDRIKYSRVAVDTKDIAESICRNARDAELIWNQRAKYVVMGPCAFSQLAREGNSGNQFLDFPITVQMGNGRIFRPLGLRIVVVPWIDGVFVMPELENPKERK